jgi:hypothetical protein
VLAPRGGFGQTGVFARRRVITRTGGEAVHVGATYLQAGSDVNSNKWDGQRARSAGLQCRQPSARGFGSAELYLTRAVLRPSEAAQ